MQPKEIAIVGAGGRGQGFAQMFAESYPKAKVAAVAEPRADYRQALAQRYQLGTDKVFESWQQFVGTVTVPQLAGEMVVLLGGWGQVKPNDAIWFDDVEVYAY
jgi:predicted dinucleotide-binding enzyme